MALTSSEVKEIEVMIRKEIKSFMNNNTVKDFRHQQCVRLSSHDHICPFCFAVGVKFERCAGHLAD